jgi:nucleoside-diphosphate-sugar epimerase
MRVAITGATGFVGCRLAERLVLAGGHEVVGAVRRLSGPGLARLARLPVQLSVADVLDREALVRAFRGCDVVVHCVYGTSGSPDEKRRVTVEGTMNVLEAAASAGAARAVHMSTAAVHGDGYDGPEVVDETSPFTRKPTPYEASKIEAEEVVWEFHRRQGYPVVVFRPPLIYGPHGRRWTVQIVEDVKAGAILVEEARGIANLVYIDNLVNALLLAVESDAGDGESFIVVDDDQLTWKDVYRAYATLVPDCPPLRSVTFKELRRMRRRAEPGLIRGSVLTPLSLLPKLLQAGLGSPQVRRELKRVPWAQWAAGVLPGQMLRRREDPGEDKTVPERDGQGGATTSRVPAPGLVRLQASVARFSGEKAKRVLGHRQRIAFPEAMERTAAWLEYQRLIPPRETGDAADERHQGRHAGTDQAGGG